MTYIHIYVSISHEGIQKKTYAYMYICSYGCGSLCVLIDTEHMDREWEGLRDSSVAKFLLFKHENLIMITRDPFLKKPGTVACTCNPGSGDMETR